MISSLVLSLILLLGTERATVSFGELRIQCDAGLDVLVDGVSNGVTGYGGVVLTIPVGPHKITLKSASGDENTFDVNISEMQATELKISSLGLRRALKRPQTGAIAVRNTSPGCRASIVDHEPENTGAELLFNGLPVGQHLVTVTCGPKTMKTTAAVRAGYIMGLEVDRKNWILRSGGEQRMSLAVDVNETGNAIATSSIPADWKRSLTRTVISGIQVESVNQLGIDRVQLTAYATDFQKAYRFQSNLYNAPGIQKIESWKTYKRENGIGLDIKLRMTSVQ
jgi:hypothetical protein